MVFERVENDYASRIMKLAEQHLTQGGFKLFCIVERNIPDIWDRWSSSTGKYHQRIDGSVPSIAEHTYEMALAGIKIIRMFPGPAISTLNDARILGILLHDRVKYGLEGKNPHTTRNHEQQMANLVMSQKKFFRRHFSEYEFNLMVDMIRYHSGQWSSDVPDKNNFNFKQYPPEVMWVHILDMLSTASRLVTD